MKSYLFDLPGSYGRFPYSRGTSGLSDRNAVTHAAPDRFIGLSGFEGDQIKNDLIFTRSRLGN